MIVKQIMAPHPTNLWTGLRGLAAAAAEPVGLGGEGIMLSVVPLTASTPQRWRGEAGGGGRDEAGAPLGEEGSAGHPDTWPKTTKGCRPPLSASHRRRAACVG